MGLLGVLTFFALLVPGWYTGSFITSMGEWGVGYQFLGVGLSALAVGLPKQIAQLPPLSKTMAFWWNTALGFYIGGHAGTAWTLGVQTHRPVWVIILGMTILLVIDFYLIAQAFTKKMHELQQTYEERMAVALRQDRGWY